MPRRHSGYDSSDEDEDDRRESNSSSHRRHLKRDDERIEPEIEYENTCKIRELNLAELHPLNDKDIKGGFRVIFIGKPGSGKSTAIESLLYSKNILFLWLKFSLVPNQKTNFLDVLFQSLLFFMILMLITLLLLKILKLDKNTLSNI